MENAHWERIKELLDEALEQPRGNVESFLNEACGNDRALIEEITSLLEHDGTNDDLFEAGAAAALVADDEDAGDALQRVGPYVLREEIGSGGMGAVFRAVRSDAHYEREVALKVIQPGMGSDHNRRFWAERQILAGLEHPNIARLYDGGWSADGRPYFAMELVDGEPIDAYCERHDVPLNDRIRMFIDVVRAVSFAHRRLVVHRDLKPGNVLVDEERTVKLVDFGIAKLLDDERGVTPKTRAGFGRLTPEYASPEQVRGGAISTATDLYSLGVILYELVTGRRPYSVDRTSPARLEESICEAVVRRPSEAVLLEDASSKQRTGRRRLHRRLRGDLDTILLKCLAKDPEERYDSAGDLANDLERHLASTPIEARPPTAGYQLRKFVRRHRVAVGGIVAFLVLLIAYTVTVTLQWQQIDAERTRTEVEAMKAQRVASFLKGLFRDANPGLERDNVSTEAALSLVDEGTRRLDSLASQPLIHAELLQTLGAIYGDLSAFQKADSLIAKSLAIRKAHLPDDHPDIAASLHDLGNVRYAQRRLDEAVDHFETAARIRRSAFGDDSPLYASSMLWRAFSMEKDASGRDEVFMEALGLLRGIHGAQSEEVAAALKFFALRQQDPVDADTLFQQALEIFRLHPEKHAVQIAEVMNDLGLRLEDDDPPRARKLLNEAIDLYREHLGERHPSTLLSMNNLAALLHDSGVPAEAEPLFREVLDARREVLPPGSMSIAYTLFRLGRVALDLQRPADAEKHLREAASILNAHLPNDDTRVVLARHYLAESLTRQGSIVSARSILEENSRRLRNRFGPDGKYVELTESALRALPIASK